MNKIVAISSLGGLTVLLLTRASEIGASAHILTTFSARGLLVSCALLAIYVLNLGEFYGSVFGAFGVRYTRPRVLLTSTASHFLNLVSKSSGLAGITLFLTEAKRSQQSTTRIAAAYFAAFVFGYVAYFLVFVTAVALLGANNALPKPYAIASLCFLLVVSVIAVTLAGAFARGRFVSLILFLVTRLNAIARHVLRRPVIDEIHVAASIDEFSDSLRDVARNPRAFARPLLHALAIEFLSAALLFSVAQGLGIHISFALALATYAFGLLFSMISITPAGLGFVEISLTLFLASMHVPQGQALALALAYRVFDFWLPVVIGAASFAAIRFWDYRLDPAQ